MARHNEARNELKQFGATVRRKRYAKNLTQAKLAELVGIDPRTVQKIEAGEVNTRLTTLTRIRRALGCSWEKLVPPPSS